MLAALLFARCRIYLKRIVLGCTMLAFEPISLLHRNVVKCKPEIRGGHSSAAIKVL